MKDAFLLLFVFFHETYSSIETLTLPTFDILTEKEKEPDKEKNKKDAQGLFYSTPHYMKLYEVFKGAYSNYQVKHRNQFFCPLIFAIKK